MKKIAAERNYKEIRKVAETPMSQANQRIANVKREIHNAYLLIVPTHGEAPASTEDLHAATVILLAQIAALRDLQDDLTQ